MIERKPGCEVLSCTFPKGACKVLERAQELAKTGTYTMQDWGIIIEFLNKEAEADNCANLADTNKKLSEISPANFQDHKEKIR